MKKFGFILIVVLCFTGEAFASDKYFYMGGAIGATMFEGEKNVYIYDYNGKKALHASMDTADITNREFSGKVYAGYRFHKHFGIETDAYYFGKAQDQGYKFDQPVAPIKSVSISGDSYHSYGFSASLLGILPVSNSLEFFTRFGLLYSRFEMVLPAKNLKTLGTNFGKPEKFDAIDEDGFSILVGGGLDYKITDHIVLRAEVEWSPDVLNRNADSMLEKVAILNTQKDSVKENPKVGYDVDMDILFISTSISYRF